MKKTLNTFQKWMTAITFAEAGEWNMAKEMSPVSVPSREISQIEQTFQKWMTAITFAEAGEWDMAREMSPVSVPSREISQIEQTFMAAAFAEAGLYDEAVRMAEGLSYQAQAPDNFLQSLGLGGVRVTYGVFVVSSAQ
jgi:hypothetical protein